MDRPRGDRFMNGPDSHQYNNQSRGGGAPSRFSDGPNRRSPNPSGFSGARDSPPRFPPGPGSGFRPMGFNSDQQMPLSGQKRGFPFSGHGTSPENIDGGSFAKLFVGSVPKTATEDDIRPLFEGQGRVLEVALIKDKRTGQQQGCCFIKYATAEEADRAIRALHNKHTLPGGAGPIQVRYADGERERVVEYKLFVGSMNKQATEKEVEEIFAPYGRVEDVYLMRDEMKQSRGCGFVKFLQREMAMAAINGLNGIFTMRGCDQPLTVRFADPKRPRPGEPRGGPAFGGPGFGPRFQPPGVRPTPNFDESMHGNIPPNPWPMSPQNMGPSSNSGMHSFGNQLLPRSGDMALSSTPGDSFGGPSSCADGSLPGLSVPSSMSQQTSIQSSPQVSSIIQQISPAQKSNPAHQHFPSSVKTQSQTPSSYSQTQTPVPSQQQFGQPQIPNAAGQNPYNQGFPSRQSHGLSGQLPVSQTQLQQNLSSSMTSLSNNLPSHVLPAIANQQQLPSQQQQQLPAHQQLHQSPSQLAQLLSQQTQTLQASFQSSQQTFSQLQQQMQLIQPSIQSLPAHQNSQPSKQQSPWTGMVPPQAVVPAVGTDVTPAASAGSVVSVMTQAITPAKCNWTEHTSPDGYKYYYNSTTGESKWEKPEELTLFEQQPQPQPQPQPHQPPQPQQQPQQQQQQPQHQQPHQHHQHHQHQQTQQHRHQHQHQQPQQQVQHQQAQQLQQPQQQQKPSIQQPQSPLYPQSLSMQQAPQTAQQLQLQNQLQTQHHYPQQLHQTSKPSQYQAHGVSPHQNLQEHGFAQFQPQASSGTMNDLTRFQQGGQAAQEWIWKNKPAGT